MSLRHFFCSSFKEELISVSINPGQTTLDLIPNEPHSLAVFLLKASKEPFDERLAR